MRRYALLWLALLMAAPASAGMADSAGLDVLLLIDRSGSIGPADRRLENELLDLTLTLLARSARAERVRHRAGVVSFGSTARIDLPMSVIDRSALQGIRSELSVADSRGSLGDTNF